MRACGWLQPCSAGSRCAIGRVLHHLPRAHRGVARGPARLPSAAALGMGLFKRKPKPKASGPSTELGYTRGFVAHYEVLHQIGKGGNGTVNFCRQRRTGRAGQWRAGGGGVLQWRCRLLSYWPTTCHAQRLQLCVPVR